MVVKYLVYIHHSSILNILFNYYRHLE